MLEITLDVWAPEGIKVQSLGPIVALESLLQTLCKPLLLLKVAAADAQQKLCMEPPGRGLPVGGQQGIAQNGCSCYQDAAETCQKLGWSHEG